MRAPLVTGLVVFAVALAALVALRQGSALHPPYPRRHAVDAALRSKGVKDFLAANHWSAARVIAFDRTDWRVTFWDGPRVVLDAAIGPTGAVDAVEEHPPGLHPPGSATLWSPYLIVLFAALFAFALAGSPLRSRRNLDLLVVTTGFTAAVFLYDARLVAAHVYVGVATLAYVAWRCALVGFGRARMDVAPELAHRLALARAGSARAATLVCMALLAAALILTITSTNPSDVAAASLAGATLLNHGTLPYGHLPSLVVHGDTYPLLTYVLFMPAAAIAPVRDAFDSLDGALYVNAVALALAAAGLARLSGRHHVMAWLAFPPVLLAASAGGNDVPTAVFVVAALLAFGRPLMTTLLLGLAGWTKVVPAAALAATIPRVRSRIAASIALLLALLAAGAVALLALGGGHGISDAVAALRFQFVRGSWYSVWQQIGSHGVQLVFQAATLAFAAVAAVHVFREGAAAVGLRRCAGLAGAVIALLQVAGNYWTYAYLPWLLPFILVALFPAAPRRSPQPAPRAP